MVANQRNSLLPEIECEGRVHLGVQDHFADENLERYVKGFGKLSIMRQCRLLMTW